MSAGPKAGPVSTSLPVLDPPGKRPAPRRNYARWRAISLGLVYVLFAVHFIHWKLAGRTLAPLEVSETMHTLELGIVTAGFCLMLLLVVGTLLLGRFFCSWACHIMALQDLCAWILAKLRIKPNQIRSRILLLVPPFTAFYMFVWPQIARAWRGQAFPDLHLRRTDAEGWASFITNDLWRSMPGPAITALTFLICGFVVIYLLGSRSFCAYVCPYGAVFALADRFAMGRIRVSDACVQCGVCTSVCKSGVHVHKEVKNHGMVIDPTCMKDLDCVANCPENALSVAFGKPSFFKSVSAGGRKGLRYDFSIREELLIALVFVAALFSLRGLYSLLPFFLSLTLAAMVAYLAVLTLRLLSRPTVTFSTIPLKADGRLTRVGQAFCGIALLLTGLLGHSAFVRYHEYSGLRQAGALAGTSTDGRADALATTAYSHLTAADEWGLFDNPRTLQSLVTVSRHLGRTENAETYAQRLLKIQPDDAATRLHLGQALAAQNRWAEAESAFEDVLAYEDAALPLRASAHQALAGAAAARGDYAGAVTHLSAARDLEPGRAAVHAELGAMLAEFGRFDEAVASLRQAVTLDPQMAGAQYNLGTLLAHMGRLDEAVACYEQALASNPHDADVLNNLGFALLMLGQPAKAQVHFERVLVIDPDNAAAHYNLATSLAAQQQSDRAAQHFQTAARLDRRYAVPADD